MKFFLKITTLSLFMFFASFTTLKADTSDVYYHVGIVSSSNEYKDYTEYGRTFFFGFGIEHSFQNNVFFGLEVSFDYIDIDSRRMRTEDNIANTAELKLGYSFNSVTGYILGGARVMSNDQDYYGFGKGLGVQYRLLEKLIAGFEYKVYDMQGAYFTYKYNTSGFNIKILY